MSASSLSNHVNVTIEKQGRILDLIDRWKIYKVDPFKGELWRFYPQSIGKKALWRKMKPHISATTGRSRYHLHYRHGNMTERSGYETITAMHLMWLVAYGGFNERLRLRPIDGDWSNYKLSNITVDLPLRKEMVEDNSKREFNRMVRYDEIRLIKGILAANPRVSPSEVSKSLELNYFSVYRAMDRIKKGLKMRFEEFGPYTQKKGTFNNMTPGDFI